jgi:dTDP-4-dehydrorhamnose reductase
MKILVTGAGGKLGGRLLRHFADKAQIAAYAKTDLDLSDTDRVRQVFQKEAPDAVLNAGAFTAVDRCETEIETAYGANERGPATLADLCREAGARLVHFSTDFVFDGRRDGPAYVETDSVNPLSEYAKSKLAGERAVLEKNPEALVLRLSWVYGSGGWNFVDWVIDEGKAGHRVRIVTDQIGTPTWVGDVATQVDRLLQTQVCGVFHCAGVGECSRYDWACQTALLADLDPDSFIEPITSEAFEQKAARPKYSSLRNLRLEKEGLLSMRPWKEALEDHIRERFS